MNWTEENNKLIAEFTFRRLSPSVGLHDRSGDLAERKNHHPVWTNVWNKVNISLTTHDEGDIITEKDRKMADSINKIYERYQYRT
jgi:4a-hydroxytetrahydrobiopterin dehydratase